MKRSALLEVRNLAVYVDTQHRGIVRGVDGVSFDLQEGEILGIVGESGSGKSMLCLALMGITPEPGGRVVDGEVMFEGVNLLDLANREWRTIRGRKIGMILQDPTTALNPCFSIGYQVGEAVTLQQGLRGRRRAGKVIGLLRRVRIPDAEDRLRSYPHQLSGGMRQRVCGAMALASVPRILIADEPTTSLDVTVEAQYLDLLRSIRDEFGVSIILITHDLSVVSRICDRVAVMYAGRIVECGPLKGIAIRPRHPYTKALFESIPRLDTEGRISAIKGRPPDAANYPLGCRFAPRCPKAAARCRQDDPYATEIGDGHSVACWFPHSYDSSEGEQDERSR